MICFYDNKDRFFEKDIQDNEVFLPYKNIFQKISMYDAQPWDIEKE